MHFLVEQTRRQQKTDNSDKANKKSENIFERPENVNTKKTKFNVALGNRKHQNKLFAAVFCRSYISFLLF